MLNDLQTLRTDIMTQITDFCANECGNSDSCSEDDCILFRIEKKD